MSKTHEHQVPPLATPAELPEQLRQQGFDAIDRLQRYLFQLLAQGQDGGDCDLATNPRLLGIFSSMGMSEWAAPIFEGLEFKTIGTFLEKIASCVKKNPILVTFAAQVASSSEGVSTFFPPQSADRDDDIEQAFFITVFLHATTNYLLWEPKSRSKAVPSRMRHLSDILAARRGKFDWRSTCTPFEQVKVTTIHKSMTDLVIPRKEGDIADTPLSRDGTLMVVNMAEAVAQDLLNGFPNNASCGVELMMASLQRPPVKGLGNGFSEEILMDGSPTGVWAQKPPLPLEWSNVYSAWNMAFLVGNFADWPFYVANLISPAVLDAESKHTALYISVRFLCLWLLIDVLLSKRATTRQPSTRKVNWKNAELTKLFGALNQAAGREYRAKIERTIDVNHAKPEDRVKARLSIRSDFEKSWMLLQLLCFTTKGQDASGMNLPTLRKLKPQLTAMIPEYQAPSTYRLWMTRFAVIRGVVVTTLSSKKRQTKRRLAGASPITLVIAVAVAVAISLSFGFAA